MKYQISYFYSKAWTFLFFAFPFILILSMNLIFGYDVKSSKEKSLIYFFLIKYITDATHVMSTYFLFLKSSAHRRALNSKLYLVPVLTILVSYLIYGYSTQTFEVILGYMALFHIVMQQFGWLKISHRLNKCDSFEQKINYSAFIGMTLMPILYWHSGASVVSPSYFYPENIKVIFSTKMAGYFVLGSYLLTAPMVFYTIFNFLKNRIVNLSSVLITIATGNIFYIGLIYAKSPTYFWLSLIITHAWGYHFFISKNLMQLEGFSSQANSYKKNTRVILSWMLAIILLAGTWYYFIFSFKHLKWVIPMLWSPLLIHYVFDSIVWKRKFLNKLGEFSQLGFQK